MRGQRKGAFLVLVMACVCCISALSQQVRLPSLFNEPDEQNDYTRNSVLQPGETPQAKIRSLIFIKTTVSKKNCYVGEPILVTYQLYTAVSCHSKVTNQVAFSGCSVIEMTSDEPESVKKEGEKIYRVQLIRRVELIPLQAGDLVIPPATVNNEVAFSTPDNPYLEKTYSADVSSEPFAIQVSNLPDGQPDDFAGITGKFTIAAKTDSTTIAAGENNRLQITIAGTGNIEAVTEPQVNWPTYTEHFDARDSQHINRANFPESGDKTFIVPFISTKKGKMAIPEISFSYFDADLKKFETITTKAIPLMITAAVKMKNPAVIVSDNLSNEKYLWFVPGIAIVVIAVWLLTNKNGKKPVTNKLPVAKEEPIQELVKEAEPARPDYEILLTSLNEAEDNRAFFSNAKTLLLSSLQFHLSPKQDDEVILLNLLTNKDEILAAEAKQIVSVCNKGLYSPVEDEAARADIIEKLSTLITTLDKT